MYKLYHLFIFGFIICFIFESGLYNLKWKGYKVAPSLSWNVVKQCLEKGQVSERWQDNKSISSSSGLSSTSPLLPGIGEKKIYRVITICITIWYLVQWPPKHFQKKTSRTWETIMIEFILLHRSFRAFDSLNVFFEVTFAMLPIYMFDFNDGFPNKNWKPMSQQFTSNRAAQQKEGRKDPQLYIYVYTGYKLAHIYGSTPAAPVPWDSRPLGQHRRLQFVAHVRHLAP